MKNREKYSDEIIKACMSGKACEFMQNVVIPEFIDARANAEGFCASGDCAIDCANLFAFWLDGEYNKPPTDWANVPVDTLVRVRDNEDDEWVLRYFDSFEEENFRSMSGHNYRVFADGATSVRRA